MERSIQRMQGIERINYFPIRHLSPAGSYHLLRLLDRIKPKCILIEGPIDGDELIPEIAGKKVKPPIAILAYTSELPVDTILYPFADYSPEYQAIVWGISHQAEVRFIDLPTEVSLSFGSRSKAAGIDNDETENGETKDGEPENGETKVEEIESGAIKDGELKNGEIKDSEPKDVDEEESIDYYEYVHNLYENVAKAAADNNYDNYWERNFEHNLSDGAYEQSLMLQSSQMRDILEPKELESLPEHASRDLVREAFMRRQIEESLSIYDPEEIVVITGAYHSKTLMERTIPMSDEELKRLPKRASKLTLMPYSYYRLSSRSGYGAGNSAPAYYELMWQHMKRGRLEDLPESYLTELGRYIRESGGYYSTANIIEAVRLSKGLAFLKEGSMPTLSDLHDSAIACIGQGEESAVMTGFAMMDIGTAIGELPEGVSQTPVQDDMARELKRLKLQKYKTSVTQELQLDLRENRKVKTEDSAFLDLNRSTFLHRLSFLGIGFAKRNQVNQDSASWKESWLLQWTPEVEIQIVEAVLKGETIELAAAFVLKERLEECADISEAANLITTSYICKLTGGVNHAIRTLQALTTESGNFRSTAEAAMTLSMLIQYGSIRQVDTEPLIPLLQQIFLRACLLLIDAAGCDNKAALDIAKSIGTMHQLTQENYELIDDEAWVKTIRELAMRDDKNSILSGLCFTILLERSFVTDEECGKEISRRLSPGIPADIGAGWFEGLSMRNRYALLSRIELFRELDGYINSLDDEEFKRSVVFMRRAFGAFEPKEKSGVAELLGDIWGVDQGGTSIALQAPLEDAEIAALEGLEEFDFDF